MQKKLHLGNARHATVLLAGTFVTAGADTDATVIGGDTAAVTAIKNAGLVAGYRITLGIGARKFTTANDLSTPIAGIKKSAGVLYHAECDELVDTLVSLGAPSDTNQFDIVLFDAAGANTQTAGITVAWHLILQGGN